MKLAAIALAGSLCAALALFAGRASLWMLRLWHVLTTKLSPSHATISQIARIGPCAAIFFLLPGGSILAALVWLCGRRHYPGHLGFAQAPVEPAVSGITRTRPESGNADLTDVPAFTCSAAEAPAASNNSGSSSLEIVCRLDTSIRSEDGSPPAKPARTVEPGIKASRRRNSGGKHDGGHNLPADFG